MIYHLLIMEENPKRAKMEDKMLRCFFSEVRLTIGMNGSVEKPSQSIH